MKTPNGTSTVLRLPVRVPARSVSLAGERVLAIDTAQLPPLMRATLDTPAVHSPWRFVSTKLLREIGAGVIVAPLISDGWDILDLGFLLGKLRFTGKLIVLSPPLPNEALIMAEIAAICPELEMILIGAES